MVAAAQTGLTLALSTIFALLPCHLESTQKKNESNFIYSLSSIRLCVVSGCIVEPMTMMTRKQLLAHTNTHTEPSVSQFIILFQQNTTDYKQWLAVRSRSGLSFHSCLCQFRWKSRFGWLGGWRSIPVWIFRSSFLANFHNKLPWQFATLSLCRCSCSRNIQFRCFGPLLPLFINNQHGKVFVRFAPSRSSDGEEAIYCVSESVWCFFSIRIIFCICFVGDAGPQRGSHPTNRCFNNYFRRQFFIQFYSFGWFF